MIARWRRCMRGDSSRTSSIGMRVFSMRREKKSERSSRRSFISVGIAFVVLLHVGAGDGDDIDGALSGGAGALFALHWVSAEIGMVVALKGEIDVIFVEDGAPELADFGIVAVDGGGVGGVMIDDELPGGFGVGELVLEPFGLRGRIQVGI